MDARTSIIYRLMSFRLRKIDRYATDSEEIQARQLTKILQRLQHTAYLKEYSNSPIKDYDTYSQRIPVVEYEDIRRWVELMLRGEKNQLMDDDCKWFATSSGTSGGRSKYLPVPKRHLRQCHYRGASDALWLYLDSRPDSQFFKHKSLVIGGSHSPSSFSSNKFTGDLSAILVENMPILGQIYRVPPKEILLMDDWTTKMQRIIESVAGKDVGSLSGVPSWMLETLMGLLKYTGASSISNIWPNLEVFFHGGISFDPYRDKYKELIPNERMQYRETYNASEGFFGIQNDPADRSMLLMQDYGLFYEFIPMSQFDAEDRRPIPLSEVKIGVNYAMVISSLGGLYRYIIGDTIQFTNLTPHKFIITGRTAHYINAFGEELMVHNTTEAISIVANEFNVTVLEYTVAPRFNLDQANGYHQWIIEFEKSPEDVDLFMSRLDEELKKLNSDYDAKRYADMTLLMPKMVIARQGLFRDWLTLQGKLGGQHKIPRLKNDAAFIDQLIEMN